MKYTLIFLFVAFFGSAAYAQEMGYDIFSTYAKPVQKEQLSTAKKMSDINPEYPASWILEEDYISTEITVFCEGERRKEKGKTNYFTEEQRNILTKADMGTTVDVEVKYHVNNSITDKYDVSTMNFSVSLVPEKEAEYEGGQEKMKMYLKQNSVDKINTFSNRVFDMAKVRFLVNEEGEAVNAEIIKSSEDEKIDRLLLKTIAKMPKWKPAESAKGVKLKQEFEFVVGMMIGC